MTEWSSDAKHELERFLANQKSRLVDSDVNADEVIEDLRAHIDEETKSLAVVTREDIVRITRHLDANESEQTKNSPPNSPPKHGIQSKTPGAPLIIFGVALPLISLLFELSLHGCAGIFFDPISTWWHALLIASVPIINGGIIFGLRSQTLKHPRCWAFASTMAIAICFYYSLILFPLYLPAIVGIFYFGIGLLPLGPLFGLVASIKCRGHLARATGLPPQVIRRWGLAGYLSMAAMVAALDGPSALTRIALEWADDLDPQAQETGIGFLRQFGSERTMLRACYERPRDFANFAALLISPNNKLNQAEARAIYFRVTGRPFNSVRTPDLYTRNGRWEVMDDLTWDFDEGLAGTAVAGRVRGLYLQGSRVDCRIHSQAGLAYLEWTFDFQNESPRQQEARTQILLPPDAVVSRLTLWVNDEEREAAFAPRSQVREAYERVVRRRRDPVLVTTTGKDRILMQCFPVPPNGGQMKTRIGVTIPLSMLSDVDGQLILPHMVERNFNLAPDLEHALWIESRSSLSSPLQSLTTGANDAGESTLFGQLSETDFLSHHAYINVTRADTPKVVWTQGQTEGSIITQQLETVESSAPSRIVLMIDDSAGMTSALPEISQALESFPSTVELFVVPSSEPAQSTSDTPMTVEEARELISALKPIGGQDNVKALVKAWDLAAGSPNGVVLWIHGPQPVLLSSPHGLEQRIERRHGKPPIYEIQTVTGPNRILEAFNANGIHRIPRTSDLRTQIQAWTESYSEGASQFQFVRHKRSRSESTDLITSPEVTDHVRRLWAAEHIEHLAAKRQWDAANHLAADEQLVTSVSGAVVLENQQQFEQAGLTPVSADSVPMIPEPQTWYLLLTGLTLLAARSRASKLNNSRG